MIAGVEGEWVLNPQRADGTVTNTPVFALLLITATVGFTLLLVAAMGLRAPGVDSRSARIGSHLTVAGAALLVVFGAISLVTGVVTGSPVEASFVAFLLGMLLLAVGPVTWGLSLRRRPTAPGVWQLLVLSGVVGFAALAIEPDPWHDISLSIMFTAWTALGVLLLRQASELGSGRSSVLQV